MLHFEGTVDQDLPRLQFWFLFVNSNDLVDLIMKLDSGQEQTKITLQYASWREIKCLHPLVKNEYVRQPTVRYPYCSEYPGAIAAPSLEAVVDLG